MKLTHIILTRDDGTRLELTVDEARQIWGHLGLVFAPPLPVAPTRPFWTPPPGDQWPIWTSPGTGDPPWVPPFVVTCATEARP